MNILFLLIERYTKLILSTNKKYKNILKSIEHLKKYGNENEKG